MNAQMSNKSKPNNSMNESQGLSSSRCPIGEQDRPVSHQATTDRSTMRRKWSQEENKATITILQRITIHILPNILQSNHNQTVKFGQLIECNKKSIFLRKLRGK